MALPANRHSLGKDAPIVSISGRSDTDVYLLRDRAIYHFDGKRAVKTKEQPICVSAYLEPPSFYPINVSNRDAEAIARRIRVKLPKSDEPPSWLVDFTTLRHDGNQVRLFGTGENIDVRGSVRRVFTARLNGGAWQCEGWFGAQGTNIVDIARDGESTFVVTQNYLDHPIYDDSGAHPFARLPNAVAGITASGVHGVWAWDWSSPTAYHLGGLVWDFHPMQGWASVAQVQAAGPGQAWATGNTTEQRSDDSGDIKADALAQWNGQAWTPIALPEGFAVQPRGLLVESSNRLWLVGEAGKYCRYDQGSLVVETGPEIVVSAVWQSPSKRWFLGGKCAAEDCLVTIGERS